MDAWGNSRCGAIDALEMEGRGERTEVNTWTDQSVLEHRPEVDGRLGDGGEERGRKSTPGPTSQCWNIALRLMDAWGNWRCGAIDALEMEGRGATWTDRSVLEHRPEVDGRLGLMDAWGNWRCGAIDTLEMEGGERTEVNTWTDQSMLEHRPEVGGRLGDGGEERGRKSTPGPTSQCWNIALRLMDAWGNWRCGAIDALEMEGRREDGSQHLDRPVSVGTSP
ncbi:hypothetical protein RRG08_002895 [Elysia crispata]|uniref:Uncharacterized protein n=1 Tax=Elysia crispata TaxID=231223 RepID=A0AAE0YVP5_9GAST|nr:hypothetical protein RRG08_002895 [Elysia crispata]